MIEEGVEVQEAMRRALCSCPDELASRLEQSSAGPRAKMLLRRFLRTESTGGVGFAAYQIPPVLTRGRGSTVWDVDGKSYIDMTAAFSVANIGHANPVIAEAIREQSDELIHCFDLPHERRIDLAERLIENTPGTHEKRVAFGVTGSEATETAMRMARWYTGAPIILSAYGAYHGMTAATMAASGRGRSWAYYYPIGPHDAGHAKIPYPYPYRCLFGTSDADDCARRCVDFVRELLSGSTSPFGGGRGDVCNVAAILVEPMQAAGGYIIPPPRYLRELRKLCDEFGMLLILDEIQTGLGRTGRLWACEHAGIVPDIIAVGKSLAGGLPLSAVVARADIASSWGAGAYLSTFAATPISCAAANATLDFLFEHRLPERAAETGEHLAQRVQSLRDRHELIGSIDSCGLFTGIEFVRDRESKEPAVAETAWMHGFCQSEGLLVQRGGPYGNRFMLMPPLVITPEEVDAGIAIIDRALAAVERGGTGP